jgi:hypothetical protein
LSRRGRRYGTRFGSWIIRFGVTQLARELAARHHPVTRHAVYKWYHGRAIPRPALARTIVSVAGGEISLDDVFAHREQLTIGTVTR